MNASAVVEEQSHKLLRITRYGSATAVDSLASLLAWNLTDNAAPQRCLLFDCPPGSRAGKGLCWAKGKRCALHLNLTSGKKGTDRISTSLDRKPVDPPPIVQLRIRDPEDPAQ